MSDKNIYQILESLDAAQRGVKQLPALFKPRDTSPQLSGPYPGRNATLGYLVGEGDETGWGSETGDSGADETPDGVSPDTQSFLDEEEQDNPMRQAVTRRIVNQHPEWITRYGVEFLMQVIDDVTEGETDWEEIGSSDVSAFVNMVGDQLRDRGGSREEMDDRRPFAAKGVAEGRVDSGNPLQRTIDFAVKNGYQVKTSPKRTRATFINRDIDHEIRATLYREPGDDMIWVNFDDHTSGVSGNDPADTFYDTFVRAYQDAAQDVSAGHADQQRKIFKQNGQPVGEVGIDRESSPGVGQYYMKHYASGTDLSGYDSFEEAVEELRHLVKQGVAESKNTTEDVISTVKKKLGDYLSDLSKEIKSDPDLKDKLERDIDQIGPAVKTLKTDDGHEIKIHGNEDDGFRITIKNREAKTRFRDLDEATMAVEMYCARRRGAVMEKDYLEER